MSDRPRTLVEALSRLPRGQARGFRFIGSDGIERYFPYEELEREALRRAGLLFSQGVRKGDRVALVIPEGHDFVLSFLGAVLAGAVPVLIFPRATFKAARDYVETVAHIAAASRAVLLLCADANEALVEPAQAEVPSLQQVRSVERLFAHELTALNFTPPSITADDVCFLQFTSGSTSRPKGVVVTHRNLIAN